MDVVTNSAVEIALHNSSKKLHLFSSFAAGLALSGLFSIVVPTQAARKAFHES